MAWNRAVVQELGAQVGEVVVPAGTGFTRHAVVCTREFEWVLFGNRWASASLKEPAKALQDTFDKVLPRASDMLGQRYTPQAVRSPSVCVSACVYV